jgi:uroporphyrinogen-III decarboxylase
MNRLTSRQRLNRAIARQDVDYVPCCFMSFTALRKRCSENLYQLVRAEKELGLDSMLFIPSAPRPERREHPDLRGLPVRFHPGVGMHEWRENGSAGPVRLYKEYTTPAGKLSTAVTLSEDWPHGLHIPFVDDYQVPRAIKPLITGPEDLPALEYLLAAPGPQDAAEYAREAGIARSFAEQEGVLLVGGWGVGVDMACWLLGMQNFTLLCLDQPDFAEQLLEMIHQWNLRRMEVVLSGPVDLYIRRAWYEGCDFVTPAFYHRVIAPRIKAEADLAHEHGVKFGYICSSGTRPMLDNYREAGIDVLIGVDPVQGTYTDLPLMKRKLGDAIALWGGVSGAITVELGEEPAVRAAVRHAIETLGPQGFVLSPVDNITVDAPRTWENIRIFIAEWKKSR